MTSVQRPDSFESAHYVGWLRRRWWIVLALAIVGLVGAFGYVMVAPKTYTATAAVNVTPVPTDQSGPTSGSKGAGSTQVNLDTEAQIVTSSTVATIAGHALHSPLTPYKLSQEISVTVPPNSSILDINCSASTAIGAAACANAFAHAYLANRSGTAVRTINSELHGLSTKISSDQKQAATLSAKIHALPKGSSQLLSTQSARNAYVSQVRSLTNTESTLTGELSQTQGGSIITSAQPPGKPSSPQKALVLPSGLLVGLLIGLLAAFLVDRRDKRLHSAKDVERQFNVPVLLDLPEAAFGREVSVVSPRSRTGHAFTELAHTTSAALGEGNHVVVVAGTASSATRSIIAANLAATLARTHAEVVLVCAALNGTMVPALLGVGDDGEGLSELVAGNATIRDVVRKPVAIPGLWVITPGADTSLAVYHLQHDVAREVTSWLRRDARYVIIEVQATEEGADTFALAEFADAAIITLETDRTERDDVADCIRRLRQLQTPVLGSVVSAPMARRPVVRPPRERPPRAATGGFDQGHDGAPVGHDQSELSALSGTSPAVADRRDRPMRTRGGQ